MTMAELLRDLIEIPERVHAGDFVLKLTEGVSHADRTIRDYVVTPQLAETFDEALDVVKKAVETNSSHATYLDGSFGSGKSHFMAVLHAILQKNPDVRNKSDLVPTITKHDPWLRDRRILLVPYHLIGAKNLDSAVLGGYVKHVGKLHPDKKLPAVYRDEALLDDARDLRARLGDERFIAELPAGEGDYRRAAWNGEFLDRAFAAPPGSRERRRLVTDLLAGPFKRYAGAMHGDGEAFIDLDQGLSVISAHAKEELGYDAIVLLLDELVLWLAGRLGDDSFVRREAQNVSKLVESAEHERPAPIVSFVPRQRDLRELVGRDIAGSQTASLFDTLKYWDGRFGRLTLADRNLREIIKRRLLRTKSTEATAVLDAAFERTARNNPQVWDVLLDAQGGGATRQDFRTTYPFSPAFLSAMIDISSALQRERSALKLTQQLLVDHRDTLEAGKIVPLGAIYDVLAAGGDKPFSDKLREEFDQAKRFYTERLRPHLLQKHNLAEDAAPTPAFRLDDLTAKTLLLAALVPHVPALRNLTANRIAALNYGSIVTMIPNQDKKQVAATLRDLASTFGQIRISGSPDDPSVEMALIGVDTQAILARARGKDDSAAKRRRLQEMLWTELGVPNSGQIESRREIVWRGTPRVVEVVFENIRDPERLDSRKFEPSEPCALRIIVDYPFDEGNFGPADDRNRLLRIRADQPNASTAGWLPHFFSQDRLSDLGDLIVIEHVLSGDVLKELAENLTEEDRHHARRQLESRCEALLVRLGDVIKEAYGVAEPDPANVGRESDQPVMPLIDGLDIRLQAGKGLNGALQWICGKLLDHQFAKHPNLDPDGSGTAYRPRDLQLVLEKIEQATQSDPKRAEVVKNDIPVLKRIGEALELGIMHEAHFVLREEWPLRIERAASKAGKTGDLTVREIKEWIRAEQPGLPEEIVSLIVYGYAIQRDRAWVRGGHVVAAPDLRNLPGDMVLRAQDLPFREEFRVASERASGLFQIERPPVASARAVHALGTAVRKKASELLPDAEMLVRELELHADLLGLGTSRRLATARTAAGLVERLAGIGEDTPLLRELASFSLDQPLETYRVNLEEAEAVAKALAGVQWSIVEAVAQRSDEQAKLVLERLRTVSVQNEQVVSLIPALKTANDDAVKLVVAAHPPIVVTPPIVTPPVVDPPPVVVPNPAKLSGGGGGATVPVPGSKEGRRTVPLSQLEAVLGDLLKLAGEHKGSKIEITWRVVD
ncbi:phage resistance protein [Streptosporangium sp. NPDC051022]|uniref:phage resistance protein n=1 Tax=Streptosporangium sp. NPDC051022 TaxID=3155752 RepID=UPI0034361E6D